MNRPIETVGAKFDKEYVPIGGTLALVRHGTSAGNEGGKWTGHLDLPLADPKGYVDAYQVADFLIERGIVFEGAYTSRLRRAGDTTAAMEQRLVASELYQRRGVREIPTVSTPTLNERGFGIYTGWRKAEVIAAVGEEEFVRLRRRWDARIPSSEEFIGESMEDVHNRAVPFVRNEIIPRVVAGENILLVAHSNIVRVTLADLHELPPGETHETLVVNNGEAHVLEFSLDGTVSDHEILRNHDVADHILYHGSHGQVLGA